MDSTEGLDPNDHHDDEDDEDDDPGGAGPPDSSHRPLPPPPPAAASTGHVAAPSAQQVDATTLAATVAYADDTVTYHPAPTPYRHLGALPHEYHRGLGLPVIHCEDCGDPLEEQHLTSKGKKRFVYHQDRRGTRCIPCGRAAGFAAATIRIPVSHDVADLPAGGLAKPS